MQCKITKFKIVDELISMIWMYLSCELSLGRGRSAKSNCLKEGLQRRGLLIVLRQWWSSSSTCSSSYDVPSVLLLQAPSTEDPPPRPPRHWPLLFISRSCPSSSLYLLNFFSLVSSVILRFSKMRQCLAMLRLLDSRPRLRPLARWHLVGPLVHREPSAASLFPTSAKTESSHNLPDQKTCFRSGPASSKLEFQRNLNFGPSWW